MAECPYRDADSEWNFGDFNAVDFDAAEVLAALRGILDLSGLILIVVIRLDPDEFFERRLTDAGEAMVRTLGKTDIDLHSWVERV